MLPFVLNEDVNLGEGCKILDVEIRDVFSSQQTKFLFCSVLF